MSENKFRYIQKALAGIEDLLLGAGSKTQSRNGETYSITKINGSLIPYSGDDEDGDMVSLNTQIDNTGVANGAYAAEAGSAIGLVYTTAAGQLQIVSLATDDIIEKTLDAGVTIEAVELKDGVITAALGSLQLDSPNGEVLIGTSTPLTDAILTLDSTTKAFVPPRMTTTQKNALTAVVGMQVYDTDLGEPQVYKPTGAAPSGAWNAMGGGADLAVTVLTPAASVVTNCATGPVFTLEIDQDSTLANPNNIEAGSTYRWEITQDGTGGWTLAFGAYFKFEVPPYINLDIAGTSTIMAYAVSTTELRCWLDPHGTGIISNKEIAATPDDDAGYWKLYSLDDNSLYFQSGAGLSYKVAGGSQYTYTGAGTSIGTDGLYTYIIFTATATFTPLTPFNVEYLIIGGGGGGGGTTAGGGGGAGGYRTDTGMALTAQEYTVTVGAGGAGGNGTTGASGGDSVFNGVTSTGGGGGGDWQISNGADGASGGGGGGNNTTYNGKGSSDTAYGNDGGNGAGIAERTGGGGGGAGAVGEDGDQSANSGAGGVGVSSVITGSTVYRAGGGGGGSNTSNYGSVGGNGGGGNGGGYGGTTSAVAGDPNTGGGGGGGGAESEGEGANGGSGVVILRFLT